MGNTKKKSKANNSNKKNKIKCVNICANNSKVSKKPVVLVNTSKKVSKRKKHTRLNYSADDVANALKAMDTGLSMRKAAAAYGVPIATLSRRKENPETTNKKTGPPTVFSQTEELEIVKWICFRAQRGLPVTKTDLLDSVQQYVKLSKKETPFIDCRPSRHWYEGFRKRHPQLSIRKPQHLTLSRAAVTSDDLKEWFEEQTKYLTEKNLNDISPMRIFNCDETYVSLCPPSEKVLLNKGSRSAYKMVDSDKEGFTVLFMYSANGDRAPPMLMFSYKEEVPEKIVKNCPEGWGIGLSDNGWMTSESFYEYITNIFHPWLLKQGTQFPIVLFLDNHSSHMNLPLVSFCREKGIELVGLVPNSTHIMQPLDISYFHPFKETWKKALPKWKNLKGVVRVKKEDFPLVLKFALDNMNGEKKAVVSGFRAAGLCPFDSSAIDYDVFNKRNKSKKTVNKQEKQDDLTEDKQKHLLTFEKNLSKELLQEFRDASLNQTWPRDLQKRGLFEYWLDISGRPGNHVKDKPIIKEVALVNINLNEIRQEHSIENLSINQASIPNNNMNFKDHSHSSNQESLTLINDQKLNKVSAPEILYKILLESDPVKIVSRQQSCTDENSNLNSLELADVLKDNISVQSSEGIPSEISNKLIFDSNMLDINNQTDSIGLQTMPVNIDLKNISTTSAITTSPTNKYLGAQRSEIFSQSVIGKENNSTTANTTSTDVGNHFNNAFTLPTNYLPKKKRIKVESSGKPKLPSAGTSDQWVQYYLEKENKRKIKEEKLQQKKKLQEEKKLLAEEKKKLQDKMREIQKKIKEEMK